MIANAKALALAACLAPLAFGAPGGVLAQPGEPRAVLAIDANKDGVLARQELVAYRLTRFFDWDRNRNGLLDPADATSLGVARANAQGFAAFLKGQDADQDAVVTFEELAKGPTPTFDRFDANHDGVLSGAELDRFVEAGRAPAPRRYEGASTPPLS